MCINRACFQNKGAGVSDSTSVCNFSREGACPSEDHLCRKQMGPVPSSGMPQTHVIDVTLWGGKAVCMPVHC